MQMVAILQSNYIPWKGYFDLMRRSDLFVILDCVQSTKNDWRNRNRIKTAQGMIWRTIPIHHSTGARINEVEVADRHWAGKHLRTLLQSYRKAPFMDDLSPDLEAVYESCADLDRLSAINRVFLDWICQRLDIKTPMIEAESLLPVARLDRLSPSERLVEICRACGATRYLSGPAALGYLEEDLFAAAAIELKFMDYKGYSEYPQLHGPFEHKVSALDLILMTGPQAMRYLERPDAQPVH